MALASSGPSPHRWEQVKKLPLYPSIRSLADYEQVVSEGTLNALKFLQEVNVLQGLHVGDFQQVHGLIFEKVHPWAGQYRTAGQVATIAGFPAAEPQRIPREISLALVQTLEIMGQAENARDGLLWLGAIAFLHVRFERIHPFLDGNGRAGRAILAVQFEALFAALPRFADQKAYRAALHASAKKDLAPLMNYLGASAGLPEVPAPWVPPFRLAPRFMEDMTQQTGLFDDLAWSRAI